MAEGFTPSEDDLTEIRRRMQEQKTAGDGLTDQRNIVLETDSPDDAAYDLKKSQELGIPREAIGGARDEYRAEDTLRKMEEMRRKTPRTSEWLAEPSNFAIAKDDAEQLSSLEDILLGMIEYKNYAGQGVASAPGALLQNLELYGMRIADNPRAAAINTVNPVPFVDLGASADAILAGRVKVRGGDEIADFGARAAKGFRNPFAGRKAEVKLPGRAYDADPIANKLSSAFARAHERRKVQVLAEKEQKDKARPQTETRTGGLLVGAERSLAEMLPYMALGLATRNPELTMSGMEANVAGESYGRYSLDPSLTDDQRFVLSGIMGKAERIGTGPVLNQLFGGRGVTGGFTKRFLTSMAMENVQEQTTTIIQDFAEWQIANPEKTAQEWLDERGDRAFDTFVVTTLASGPVNAAVIATEQAMTEIGKDTRETEMSPGDTLIDTLLEKAGKSKLRGRSPEKFSEAISKQIQDTGTETITVDLDGLAQSLEAAGLSVADTLEELGVPADAISETAVIMGTVEIPTARLLASEAAQTHRDKIQPHLRLADDPLTPAQKEAVGAEVMKQAEFISDDIAEKIKTDADFAGQIAEVEDQVTEQLRTAGFSGQTSVLRANAVLASRMAGYIAKRSGKDVRSVWAEMGPRIVGSFGEAGQTDVLRQQEEAALLEQLGYHGTPGKIDGAIRPSADGLLGPGIYLAKQKDRARAYAGPNGQVLELDVDESRLATYAQWKAARSEAGREAGAGQDRAANKIAADRLAAEGFIGVDAGDTITVWDAANINQTGTEEIEFDDNYWREKQTSLLPGFGTPEFEKSREFTFDGEKVVGYDAAVKRLIAQAEAYVGPEGAASERKATILVGPPGAGKSTFGEALAKATRNAIVTADDAKHVLPEFHAEGVYGADIVHRESSVLSGWVLAELVAAGKNITVEKLGDSWDSLSSLAARLKMEGYEVQIVSVTAPRDVLLDRIRERYLRTKRFVPNETVDRALAGVPGALASARESGLFSGVVEIDNGGAIPHITAGKEALPDGFETAAEEIAAQRALAGSGRGRGNAESAGPGRQGQGAFQGDELNQLIGPRAKGADKAVLGVAQKMAKERVKTGKGLFAKSKPKYTRQQIWDETAKLGQPWYQDKNGDWISEIDDGAIVVREIKGKMSEVVEMPSIYAQYPELAKQTADARDKVKVREEGGKDAPGTLGAYTKYPFLMGVNLRISDRSKQGQPYTATHEIQHAVDEIEDREMGRKNPYFQRDTEIRAFNTMYRRLWTMEERIATPPWKTEEEAVRWWGGLRDNNAPRAEHMKPGTPDPGMQVVPPERTTPKAAPDENVPEGARERDLAMEGELVETGGRVSYTDIYGQQGRESIVREAHVNPTALMGRTFLSIRDLMRSAAKNERIAEVLFDDASAADGDYVFTDNLPEGTVGYQSLRTKITIGPSVQPVVMIGETDQQAQARIRAALQAIGATPDEAEVLRIAISRDMPGPDAVLNSLDQMIKNRPDLINWQDTARLREFAQAMKASTGEPETRQRYTPPRTKAEEAREAKRLESALADKLLDMDAQVSAQPAPIRAVLEGMIAREQSRPDLLDAQYVQTEPGFFDGMTVNQLLRELASSMQDEQGVRDPMVDLIRQLRAAGIVGAKYVPGGVNTAADAPPQTQSIVIFDERAPVLLTDQSGNLMQERRGGYSPSTRQIVFTEARDVSTFMHETAHWFLDTLEKLAPTEAWAAADLAEIEAWWGGVKDTPAMAAVRARYSVVPSGGGWQVLYRGQPMERPFASEAEALARIEWRERQEAFAETFEQYLQTGKAPTPKLVEVFRAFRDWLVQLYKGMAPREREALNPEIQAVFDRVLAVDTEVDAASAEAFRDADTMAKEMLEKGVITERQYRMVGERLNKAREEVKEEMISRALKEEMRTREDWWAKERARVKGDLARAFDKSEVGRVFNWLAYGEWKGDVADAEATEALSDAELFQNRGEIVSEAQLAAHEQFADEIEKILDESEFQWSMLDDELLKLIAPIEARIEQIEQTDVVQIAQDAADKVWEDGEQELDPDSDTYDSDFAELEARYEEAYRVAYEKAEADMEALLIPLNEQRDAQAEADANRLEGQAIGQIEAYRERAITEVVDRFENAYGAAPLLDNVYVYYMQYDQKARTRMVLGGDGALRSLWDILSDDSLSQSARTFNPPGHGPVAPPPDVPPVRLDLKIVKDLYGEEAVKKLPAAVRRRSRTSTNVTDLLQQIEAARKTLAKRKRGPQTLTQFIMAKKRTKQDGTKEDIPWGIKGAADELKAMGLGKLINEKSGRTLDYVREAAEEAGFIRPRAVDADLNREASDLDTTLNDLLEALAREAKGEAVVRIGEEGDTKEAEDARIWATWLEQNGVDIYEADKKKLRASVEAMLSATDESLISPDQAAELFGFPNGEELLNALAQVGNRDAFLNAQADRKMSEEFGDMMKDGTLIEEAREAARLDILGRQSEIELEALSRAVGQQASANYAKQMARDIIALRTVKEIAAYERDLDNERRFSKQALSAVAKGDYAAALKAKQRQIIAAQMYREGKKAHERIEKQRKDLLRYLTSESRRDKIANDYLERIDAVLDDFELRVSKQGPSVQKARQSAAAYVAWMTEQGREAEIAPEAMLLATQASLKTWRNLTADEVDYLVGTIENLSHLGRTKQRLLNEKEKREFRAVVAEIVDVLEAAPSTRKRGKSFSPGMVEDATIKLSKFDAKLTKIPDEFEWLDGKQAGPLATSILLPIEQADVRKMTMIRAATKEVRRLWKAMPANMRKALVKKHVSTPELPLPRGDTMTMMDVVLIGLNWGNEGNRQALLDGYGWEAANVEAVLNRYLTDAHWDFITGMWTLIGSYRDDAFALQKRMTGTAPKAVEGIAFTLASGRKIQGAYFPLKYDGDQESALAVKQQKLDEKQMMAEMGFSFTKPMTRTGHMIERVGSGGKPVKMSIDVLYEHVENVIHDIAFRPAVIDAFKIIRDPAFTSAYIASAGKAQYDRLMPWLHSIATNNRTRFSTTFSKMMTSMRGRWSVAMMGFSIRTATQQLTGYMEAATEIGPRWVMQGALKTLGAGPSSFWREWTFIRDRSEYLANRVAIGKERDIRSVMSNVKPGGMLAPVRENAFIFLSMMDAIIGAGVWRGAYDKAQAGRVPGIEATDEEAAIAYADRSVQRSLSSGETYQLPEIMREGEISALMTMVYSYGSKTFNRQRLRNLKLRYGQMDLATYTASTFIAFIAVPIIAALLAGRMWPDDDEDEWEDRADEAGMEVLMNAAGTAPFVRDMVSFLSRPEYGFQLSPVQSTFEQIGGAARDAAEGKTLDSQYRTKQAVFAVATVLGLPANQLWTSGDYVYDVIMGNEDPTEEPLDAAREALVRDTR